MLAELQHDTGMNPDELNFEGEAGEGTSSLTPSITEYGRVADLEKRFEQLAAELLRVGREWLYEWRGSGAAGLDNGELAKIIGAHLPDLVISCEADSPDRDGGFARIRLAMSQRTSVGSRPRLRIFRSQARAY